MYNRLYIFLYKENSYFFGLGFNQKYSISCALTDKIRIKIKVFILVKSLQTFKSHVIL